MYLPEEAGIKQVEDIGVHFHHDGSVVYGSRIDTIMGAPPTESSLDLLTRVLVDLEQDTGFITSNLLTMYQRVMLDSLHCNSSQSRPKYRMIMADSIAAVRPAAADAAADGGQEETVQLALDEELIGNAAYKNELRQIVGEIEQMRVFTAGDGASERRLSALVVIGRVGMVRAAASPARTARALGGPRWCAAADAPRPTRRG